MEFWTKENRLDAVRAVCQKARSRQEAVILLDKKYDIKTNRNVLSVLCSNHNIPRPLISANHGGDRFGKKREKK